MKKRLEMLEQLQEVDSLVDVLKTSQNRLTTEMNEIAQSLDVAREGLTALQQRAEQLKTEKTELEASHATELENIRRSETNKKEIKTNKEYQAVEREITAARKQVTTLEEQILQSISQSEELAAEIAAAESHLAELEQNSEQRCAEKQTEVDKLQQDIGVDSLRRDNIIKELPANLVKRYDSLRQQRRGRAIAVARDGYCLECNMHLPPQLYNSLFKGDELLACPHCQRVLILKQQAQ